MKTHSRTLFCFIVIGFCAFAACGQSYVWFTEHETGPDGVRHPWLHGDTIYGNVRSNDTIAIMGDPVFYGRIITTASDFWRGAGYNPHFSEPPFFAMRHEYFPASAENIRRGAAQMGTFYNFQGYAMRAYIGPHNMLTLYKWREGTEFDPSDHWTLPVSTSEGTCVFVDGPLEISGDTTGGPWGHGFAGRLTIGSSENIRILDNIRTEDAVMPFGIVPSNSLNVLGLIAEQNIIIANTWANGRNNSGIAPPASGYTQNNPRRTGIIITAALIAVNGSFTFEQQNDLSDGYQCECQPDDRGTIYLHGSIVQRQRDFLHRSTNGSTGYIKYLRFDERLMINRPPCFFDAIGSAEPSTDSIDFGDVVFGTTRWDTAQINLRFSWNLGLVNAYYPFWADRLPGVSNHFAIPVSFTPPQVGTYIGVLIVGTPERYFQIPLIGRGVNPPHLLTVSASPNPFNSVTKIRYNLPEAGAAQIRLYDILGRTALNLDQSAKEAGEHFLTIDGSKLATGVFFLSVKAGKAQVTQKLLLLK
jgi:hypothetical protein